MINIIYYINLGCLCVCLSVTTILHFNSPTEPVAVMTKRGAAFSMAEPVAVMTKRVVAFSMAEPVAVR